MTDSNRLQITVTPKFRQELDLLRGMIDISADRLEGLRTQCVTSAVLTQQEIRTLEVKLVKMFSELLGIKAKMLNRLSDGSSNIDVDLKQWLRVVGLSIVSLNVVMKQVNSLEMLLNQNDEEVTEMLKQNVNTGEEEMRRLRRAMSNLKRCRASVCSDSNELHELFWDSWIQLSNIDQSGRTRDVFDATNGNIQYQDQPPRTPFKRGPLIAHRFTKKFKALSTCDYCSKQMFFGLKCIECKYRCHKDCESSVPPSCGVPPELMDEFKQSFAMDEHHSNTSPDIIDAGSGFFFSSRSSISKLPVQSSPAKTQQGPPPQTPATLKNYLFDFVASSSADGMGCLSETSTSLSTAHKEQPNKLSSTSLTESSMSTSIDSMPSDSAEDRQSEWGIQFDDINILDKIGRGRFGTVHRGLWYGDVAVKLLNENYLNDGRTLESFKNEVATFKNTRHDNLVLFMGFCMQPQAIVTSLCKGNTLYTHLHLRKDKFNLYRAANVAQQITLGMGYLHAKGIVHKDLTTKNIFLENSRVVITDFGLFSAMKMQYGNNGLHIPNNWLCYLAPELLRGLRQAQPTHDELPFSKASDVYAFGTVWYEVLSGEFPFKQQPPESIIFQIGCGMKQTLANLQATRDVKDILMICWAFQRDDRPDFAKLLMLLKQLPKKQMPKTPTRRVHLSLSAESVF